MQLTVYWQRSSKYTHSTGQRYTKRCVSTLSGLNPATDQVYQAGFGGFNILLWSRLTLCFSFAIHAKHARPEAQCVSDNWKSSILLPPLRTGRQPTQPYRFGALEVG